MSDFAALASTPFAGVIRFLTPTVGARINRTVASAVFCLLLLGVQAVNPSRAVAQEAPDLPLRPGSWALQFSVNDNFTLGSYLGSAVSVKRHTSATRAWQLGLSIGTRFDWHDEEVGASNLNRETIGVTARHVVYPLFAERSDELVQLFVGIGPRLRFGRSSTSTETAVNWGAGLSGTIGAEWFVQRRVSLHAAYGTVLSYVRSSHERDVEGQDPRDRTSNGIQFGAEGVRFGVSAYF